MVANDQNENDIHTSMHIYIYQTGPKFTLYGAVFIV